MGVSLVDDDAKLGALPAQQERSRRTRDAILKAVAEALEGDASGKATVQEIASAAGVSIGAFYGRFKNKDAAIEALFHERRAGFVAKLSELNAQAPTLDVWTKGAVRLAMDHAFQNRALIARAAQRDAPILSIQGAARSDSIAMAEDLARQFGRLAPELPDREALSVAAFSIAMLGAMSRDAAVFSSSLLADPVSRAWLSENIAQAITSFVHSKCPPS